MSSMMAAVTGDVNRSVASLLAAKSLNAPDELDHQLAHFHGRVCLDEVSAVGDVLDAQIGNVLHEVGQRLGCEERIEVAPYHQGRDVDPAHQTAHPFAETHGAVVVGHAGESSRLCPGVDVTFDFAGR